MDAECLCGNCRECRADTAEPRKRIISSTPLGETAQAILDEGIGYYPERPVRKPPKQRNEPGVTWSKSDAEKRKAKRAAHMKERVWVNGHWENPYAPHGTTTGAGIFCCCCPVCREVTKARMDAHREKKRKATEAKASHGSAEAC